MLTGQQQFEQQHGPLRSRSTTPRAGAQRAANKRSCSPELADFLDAASVALWHIPFLRERLTSLQASSPYLLLPAETLQHPQGSLVCMLSYTGPCFHLR